LIRRVRKTVPAGARDEVGNEQRVTDLGHFVVKDHVRNALLDLLQLLFDQQTEYVEMVQWFTASRPDNRSRWILPISSVRAAKIGKQ
jgi:hypothetical protein